jgi:RHS repeat-associated protein
VSSQATPAALERRGKDHLGNGRVYCYHNAALNQAKTIQETHYYPFGLPIQKLSPNFEAAAGVEANNYQYNNKELNEDFGLHWSHHEYRFLDLQINRWTSIDPLTEKINSVSSYCFVHNNPIRFRDPYGLEPDTLLNNSDGIPDVMLKAFEITATKINKTHSDHIWWYMKKGHQNSLKSTGGYYNRIKFGPRLTADIGDYAYQEGLGTLTYPIMATLSGVGLALFTPALPPLLEQSSLSIYGIKAISSGGLQAIITRQIDIPDLLGDTFLTPIYSGLLGGEIDYAFSLRTQTFEFAYFGIGGTKPGTNFLLDFGSSAGTGLYGNASENMFKSFIATEAKTTPLFVFPAVTSPLFSGINYFGSKTANDQNK